MFDADLEFTTGEEAPKQYSPSVPFQDVYVSPPVFEKLMPDATPPAVPPKPYACFVEGGWHSDLVKGIVLFYKSEAYKNVKGKQTNALRKEDKKQYYDEFETTVKPHLQKCPKFLALPQARRGSGTYGVVTKCTDNICLKQIKKEGKKDPVEIILEAFIQQLVFCLCARACEPTMICRGEGSKNYSLVTGTLGNGLDKYMDEPAVTAKHVVQVLAELAHMLHEINQSAQRYNMSFSHRDLTTRNIMYKMGDLRERQCKVDGIGITFQSAYEWRLIDFGMSCLTVSNMSTTFTTGYRNYFQEEEMNCKPDCDMSLLFYDILSQESKWVKFPRLCDSIRQIFYLNKLSPPMLDTFKKSLEKDRKMGPQQNKWSYWHFKNYHPISPKEVLLWAQSFIQGA